MNKNTNCEENLSFSFSLSLSELFTHYIQDDFFFRCADLAEEEICRLSALISPTKSTLLLSDAPFG